MDLKDERGDLCADEAFGGPTATGPGADSFVGATTVGGAAAVVIVVVVAIEWVDGGKYLRRVACSRSPFARDRTRLHMPLRPYAPMPPHHPAIYELHMVLVYTILVEATHGHVSAVSISGTWPQFASARPSAWAVGLGT